MRSLLSPLGEARIVTEFFGGSEGTYGINESLLLNRACLRRGKGKESGVPSQPFPPLPEPQRFVALTGADVFMEFLPVYSDGGGGGGGMIDGKEDEDESKGGGRKETHACSSLHEALSVAEGPIPPGRYELVVTSFSGLARYRVGDVVRVVGAFEPPTEEEEEDEEEDESEDEKEAEGRRTVATKVGLLRGAPVFEFVGRAGSALNLVWEKFDEGAILAAVAQAARGFGGEEGEGWKDFAAREDLGDGNAPSYRFYLEGETSSSSPSSTATAQRWANALESSLREHNSIYELLQVKKQISPLKVSVVSKGTFDSLRDAAVASGTAHAQYKTPVVVEADPEGKRTRLLEERVVETVQASSG